MHQHELYPAPDRLLRLREVLSLTGLPRSTLYHRIKRGRFPKPQKQGWISLWRFSEVERYLSDNRYSQSKEAGTPLALESPQKTGLENKLC